ncbi:hypothetical protein ACROYT_G010900, partial [Oculina patagonica]
VVAVNGDAQILTNTDKLVVTNPEDLPLGDDERSLLAKGVNFIPTTSATDEFQLKEDNEKFFRRLLLKAHFHETNENTNVEEQNNEHDDTVDVITSNTNGNTTNQQQNTLTESFLESLKPKQSKWTPPPGKFTAVDHFIDKCRREVNQIDFKRRLTQHNLSLNEQQALRKLRNRRDVVIRQADKGGAFVVWRRDLYIAEANRQLEDQRFFEKIPSDATQSSQQAVK